MNAAETIAAAIGKLEVLNATSFAGPWEAYHSGVANGDHSYVIANGASIAYISANDGIDEEFRAPTADLIVALYRTINSQLKILLHDLEILPKYRDHGLVDAWENAVTRAGDLELARAILGQGS